MADLRHSPLYGELHGADAVDQPQVPRAEPAQGGLELLHLTRAGADFGDVGKLNGKSARTGVQCAARPPFDQQLISNESTI